MTQLTIRNFSPELEKKIRSLAKERECSLNKAAVFLLNQGAGISDRPMAQGIGHGLDTFIGTWNQSEAEAFDQRIEAAFESVDDDLWQTRFNRT